MKSKQAHLILKTCFGSLNNVWREGPYPERLSSRVQLTFTRTSCNTCYRLREHLFTGRASYVNKHLQNSEACHWASLSDSFSILDHASTKIQLKIKEALHIL